MTTMERCKLVRAARVVPVVSPTIDDGALLLDGDRIAALGPFETLRQQYPDVLVEDLGQAIVLPPLVNAHTHLELTHFPQWQQQFPSEDADAFGEEGFVGWILTLIGIKRQLSIDDCRASLEEGIRRCLQGGVGFVGDILSLHTLGQVYQDAPLRGRLFYETLGVRPEVTDTSYAHLIGYMNAGHVGAMTTGVSPHAPYTLSADYLKHVLHSGHAAGWPLATHLAESPEETALIQDGAGPMADRLYPYVGWEDAVPAPTGKTPWRYLQELEPSQAGDLLIHGVQLSPTDIEELAASGATLVLCPRSNVKLGVGIAPVSALTDAGVPLALGTDSLASNDSLSMWDEMAAAWQLYPTMTAEQVLQLATVDGAKALGLPEGTASLQTRGEASYQVLRPKRLPPLAETAPFLCAGERGREVQQLVIQGRSQLPLAD